MMKLSKPCLPSIRPKTASRRLITSSLQTQDRSISTSPPLNPQKNPELPKKDLESGKKIDFSEQIFMKENCFRIKGQEINKKELVERQQRELGVFVEKERLNSDLQIKNMQGGWKNNF
jgi:hypothetical protein